MVYGTALHLLADAEGAADVTEAVFVELWTRAHEYVATDVALHPLLTGLTHHHAGRRRTHPRARITPVLACLADPGCLPWS